MKSKDIWENLIVCNRCGSKTEKIEIDKEGFKIRTWRCKKCGKEWYHPIDSNQYLKWKKLKNERFRVRLRQVGNSFTVSVPKEIVNLEHLKIGLEAEWSFQTPRKWIFNLGAKQ